MTRHPPISTLFPYPTLSRPISGVVFSGVAGAGTDHNGNRGAARQSRIGDVTVPDRWTSDGGQTWSTASQSMMSIAAKVAPSDRKSTRLNSRHLVISYAVFCL